jgi:hypothetical protein
MSLSAKAAKAAKRCLGLTNITTKESMYLDLLPIDWPPDVERVITWCDFTLVRSAAPKTKHGLPLH